MTVRFEISSPSGERTISIDRNTVLVVGRAPDADLRLDDDPHFSRRHFLLEVAPPACQLIDLDSRNGTMVNGEPASSLCLSHGDIISGGRTQITFLVESGATDASTLDLPSSASRTRGGRRRRSTIRMFWRSLTTRTLSTSISGSGAPAGWSLPDSPGDRPRRHGGCLSGRTHGRRRYRCPQSRAAATCGQ